MSKIEPFKKSDLWDFFFLISIINYGYKPIFIKIRQYLGHIIWGRTWGLFGVAKIGSKRLKSQRNIIFSWNFVSISYFWRRIRKNSNYLFWDFWVLYMSQKRMFWNNSFFGCHSLDFYIFLKNLKIWVTVPYIQTK